jgi:hypothetical protein
MVRMWKETVVVRCRHIRGVTEETTCVEDCNFETVAGFAASSSLTDTTDPAANQSSLISSYVTCGNAISSAATTAAD